MHAYVPLIFLLFYFRNVNSSFEDSLLRPIAMVSRRKILSRSRDDLNLDSDNLQDSDPNADLNPYNYRNNRRINLMDTEDDVWYHKDKLYKVSLLSNTHIMNIFFIKRPYLSLIQPTTSKKTYIFAMSMILISVKIVEQKIF